MSSTTKPGFALLVYLVVSLVLLWGVTLAALFTEQESLLKDAEVEVDRLNQLVAHQTGSLFGEVRAGLVLLDHWLQANPSADPRTDSQFSGLVTSVRNGFQSPVEFRVVSQTGDLFVVPSPTPLTPSTSVVDREYFRRQLSPETWGLYLSAPVVGRVTSAFGVPISYPITHRNAGMAAMVVLVDTQKLNDFYDDARPKPDGRIMVLRQDGVILGVIPLQADYLGLSVADDPWWVNRPQGSHRSHSPVRGSFWVTSFRDLPGAPLVTVVSKPYDVILAAWKLRFFYGVGALAIVSVLMSLWGLVLGRNWKQLALSEAEKRTLADELGRTMEISDTVAEHSNDIVAILRFPGLVFEYVNSAMTRSRGWNPDELIEKPLSQGLSPDTNQRLLSTLQDLVRRYEGGDHTARFGKLDLELPHKDGTLSPFEVMMTLMGDSEGRVGRILAICRDLTERNAREEIIRQMAFHDQLTGVPNRRLLEDRLTQALARSVRDGGRGALLFLDLDRFKPINDSLGHAAGDWLLQQVALRITEAVRTTDTVARIGGDEFVVLLVDLADPRQATVVAEKIRLSVSQPYTWDGAPMLVSASVGIVLFPDHGDTPASLIRLSDAAMYQAKSQGRNQVAHYVSPPSQKK